MGRASKVEEMTLAEKLQTMEALWDDLCHHAEDVVAPAWHREVLAARGADLQEGRDSFSDWESAKDAIRELVK